MTKELEALERMFTESDYRGVTVDYDIIKSALKRKKRLETKNTELKVRNKKMEKVFNIIKLIIEDNNDLLLSYPPKHRLHITLSVEDYWKFKEILEEK